MKEFNEEYLDNIRQIIADRDNARAEALLEELHPADIAELYDALDLEQAEYLYRLLDGDKAADVLMELDEEDRHEVLSHIDDVDQAGDIIDLLKYDEDTAGGLMGTEMLVVNENWSMPECIKQLRMQAEDMDEVYNVYVVDNDDRLRGTLPLKELITHPSVSKIKNVMETEPVAVKTDTTLDDVAIDFEKYDLVAMPVVDSIGRLVGHITVDDVMDGTRLPVGQRSFAGRRIGRHTLDPDKSTPPVAAHGYRGRHRQLAHSRQFRAGIRHQPRHGAVHPHDRRHRRKCGHPVLGHRGAGSCQRLARP